MAGIGPHPKKRPQPGGRLRPKLQGREETVPHIGTILIVGSQSANPIKFAFREWPVSHLRMAYFGQHRYFGAGPFPSPVTVNGPS
jgi:hypothetical protein